MKYYEFNINLNKIEFFNSIYGLERVVVNGEPVSKKFSLLGTEHKIKIQTEDWELQSKYELFATKNLELYLKKNGKTKCKFTKYYNFKRNILSIK